MNGLGTTIVTRYLPQMQVLYPQLRGLGLPNGIGTALGGVSVSVGGVVQAW